MVEFLGREPMRAGLFDRDGKLMRVPDSTTEIVIEQTEEGARWLRVLKIPQAGGEELRVVADVTEAVRFAALRSALRFLTPPTPTLASLSARDRDALRELAANGGDICAASIAVGATPAEVMISIVRQLA